KMKKELLVILTLFFYVGWANAKAQQSTAPDTGKTDTAKMMAGKTFREGLHAMVTSSSSGTDRKITIVFNSLLVSRYRIQITDMGGGEIISDEGECHEGENYHSLDLNKLAKGVYLVSLIATDANMSMKLRIP